MSDRAATARAKSAALAVVPALVALVAYRSSPGFGLVSDAVFLIADNEQMRSWRWLPHVLTSDYFEATTGFTIGYWRPVTKGSWLVETMLGGGATAVYHAVNVAWLALASCLVAALSRRLGAGPLSAAFVGAMFAVHPALIEPTCLVMARSDLVCAAASIAALVTWLRWLERGGAGWLTVHALAFAVALGSKETAVVLLPAIAIRLAIDPATARSPRAWIAGLGPSAVTTALYFAGRHLVLGGSSGTSLSLRPDRIVSGLGMYGLGLNPFAVDSGVRAMPAAEAGSAGALLAGAIVVVLLAALAARLVMRRAWDHLVVALWGLGCVLLVLLVSDLNIPGVDERTYALADRWMVPAVASALALVGASSRSWPLVVRRPLAAVALVWIASVAALGPTLHAPYRDGVALLDIEDRDFEDTPEHLRTEVAICRYQERALIRALAASGSLEPAMRAMSTLESSGCVVGAEQLSNLLSALVRERRWSEARPVAERLATFPASDRDRFRTAFLIGLTFLQTGATERAVPLLRFASRSGPNACAAAGALGRASAQLGRWTDAADALEQALVCFAATDAPIDPGLRAAAAEARRRADVAPDDGSAAPLAPDPTVRED